MKMSYEAAMKRAEPYTKIVEELPQMRRETVHLVRQAVSEGRCAFVLVNNRSEGNVPLTVHAPSKMLRGLEPRHKLCAEGDLIGRATELEKRHPSVPRHPIQGEEHLSPTEIGKVRDDIV